MRVRDDGTERGRMIAHYMVGELEKIAAGADAAAQQQTPAGQLEEGVQQGTQAGIESSPAHGVVAANVEQLDSKRARGIPQIEPPPGYIYQPELAAFIPDQQDPGWMTEQVAAKAGENKGWYDQGQQDTVTGQAQQEMDGQIQQQAEQASSDQQQQQAAAEQQQAITANAERKAVESAAKDQAKAEMAAPAVPMQNIQTPESIAGSAEPAKKKKSKPKKKKQDASEKGVHITIGK